MYRGYSTTPRVDQQKVLTWLREMGATKAVATAWGYNDEGGCEAVVIYKDKERLTEIYDPNWYDWNAKKEKEVNENAPKTHLWNWLGAPLEEEYGGWGGEDRVGATSTLDVATGKVESHGYRDSYSRSEW
jgi:hypothetical protein